MTRGRTVELYFAVQRSGLCCVAAEEWHLGFSVPQWLAPRFFTADELDAERKLLTFTRGLSGRSGCGLCTLWIFRSFPVTDRSQGLS